MGERVLGVGGAIDYADPVGQVFIDTRRPIYVRGAETYDRQKAYDYPHLFGTERLSLGVKALPAIESYFMGAPLEPIESILLSSKPLFQKL
jgi:hypothetical protein